jgi:hypothetical protein
MAVGAGLRACPIKILFLKVKIRIAAHRLPPLIINYYFDKNLNSLN